VQDLARDLKGAVAEHKVAEEQGRTDLAEYASRAAESRGKFNQEMAELARYALDPPSRELLERTAAEMAERDAGDARSRARVEGRRLAEGYWKAWEAFHKLGEPPFGRWTADRSYFVHAITGWAHGFASADEFLKLVSGKYFTEFESEERTAPEADAVVAASEGVRAHEALYAPDGSARRKTAPPGPADQGRDT
jgi:hypothetical protein